MTTVILIGFQYNDKISEKSSDYPKECIKESTNMEIQMNRLPGIIIDLYQCYCFVQKIKPERILLITDIPEDQQFTLLKGAIIDQIVDQNIFTFIEKCKTKQQYIKYSTYIDFMATISLNCHLSDRVLIYYTGHAKNGCLILPDDNLVPLTKLRETITQCSPPHCNILIILDCCNCNGLELPFRLHRTDSTWKMPYRYMYNIGGDRYFCKQKIICISSTTNNENSGVNNLGSIFTRSIFKFLTNKTRSLGTLVENINNECRNCYNQTSNVYSSHPDIYQIWNWVFDKNSVIITMDNNYISISL